MVFCLANVHIENVSVASIYADMALSLGDLFQDGKKSYKNKDCCWLVKRFAMIFSLKL